MRSRYFSAIPCKALRAAFIAFVVNAGDGFAAQDCQETALTQYEMNECAESQKRQAERELDHVYKILSGKISSESRPALQDAKKAWLYYRAKQCEFDSLGTVTGSIHPMIVSYCLQAATLDYIKVLERQIKCDQHDLSCGNQ